MAVKAEAQKGMSQRFVAGSDAAMVVGMVGILMIMLIPLPTVLLDVLLALNITVSILVLLIAMYSVNPLDFHTFPTVLLVATLFRLSLNIASARLILLYGHEGTSAAGTVIQSFGSFVVGGNYVVGVIVFIILVVINFVVITKGSVRIAEVAARFTLDAMPGKQMSIDADLNAGLIDEDEARTRRKEINREAEFHGAMDGASKFVRGDAIAGIAILLVNIVGGFIIGTIQKNLSLLSAAQTYTLLTVGDGLVTQIPSLLVSTASGIVVSRAATEASLGSELAKQFLSRPEAIYMSSIILFFFGLIPGLPHLSFFIIGIIMAGSAYLVRREQAVKKVKIAKETATRKPTAGPEPVEHLLMLDILELEVGYGIIPLVDRDQDGELLERIRGIRRQFAIDMGIIVPPLHIRDNMKLGPTEYRILIKGVEVAKGELMIKHLLAMDPGNVTRKISGIATIEPAFNLPAVWIPESKKDEAAFSGYTVVDNPTIIATHLTEVIRKHSDELLDRQGVQDLLDNLKKTHPKAVEELTPGLIPLGIIQKVLQNLVREQVTIRDLLTIVETLADYAPVTKDPEVLTEYVRQRLARTIVVQYLRSDGVLPVITLDDDLEKILANSIQRTDHGSYLAIEPKAAKRIITCVKEEVERVLAKNEQPVILCSPIIRRYLRKMLEQFMSQITVLSHAEILHNMNYKAIGVIKIKNAA
ncbi:MAG: flagellar biosynthesis protein FlhA [Pseudomonadota bacterium]